MLTHAFRPFPNAPVTGQGKIRQAVRDARERGVLFDIGHGKGSFSFKTARAMLANGFYPDTISSDVHALCIDGPAFDQVTTLSKFLCLGMPLNDVIRASTVNAAFALRRPELGSLKPGSVGDATLLSVREGRFDYVDVVGEHLIGDRRIVSEGVVIGGKWWHPAVSSAARRLRHEAGGTAGATRIDRCPTCRSPSPTTCHSSATATPPISRGKGRAKPTAPITSARSAET